ncbi:MAG TPA: ATP-binding protein [Verrucomicrobiota bacterium]|nr:PAS domain-containing sensor histidine kinase [Verrucomicrobiales bacterium]HRI13886.1 ATP-binding protein [Verrucomicrobiota bacterium]
MISPAPQMRFERRLKLLALAVGVPGVVVTLLLLGFGDYSPRTRWTLGALVFVGSWIAIAVLVHRVIFPLQTLANLLGGLREGDFSTRARGAVRDDALGEVLLEANALAETLRQQRLGALEATALLRTVMTELDAAVFAFDDQQRLRLANRAAENVLRRPAEQLLGRTAAELGLGECLAGESTRTMSLTLPGAVGRFGVRRSGFRQDGRPHQLLVLTDLSRALREEERLAWQRLVRVLGHELNNSLAPIKSLAGSLESLLARDPLPEDWRDDTRRGLAVISQRSEALTRFMEAYARLAKLPAPRKQLVDLPALIRRVTAVETRVSLAVTGGPPVKVPADPDQLEQLLINLLRNAADAVLQSRGESSASPGLDPVVAIGWHKLPTELEICLTDTGPGLANPANLFVPFFTTKPKGSGIGLTLCRQIAEAHGGSIALENREDRSGCVARLRLPLTDPSLSATPTPLSHAVGS